MEILINLFIAAGEVINFFQLRILSWLHVLVRLDIKLCI
jgi:hypothetical protein